ncbi:hypothetical protein SAMD00019534_011920 [Acytostelium subglobosum LB1]|uniref:hypothetical protein n=1 Tax=Acytostelium subglobosum LB1 TaxID=1410327 RepID=UPI0006449411|nr:hypothetical protein SAMD00019534_011920 [Acytostelium subglobosum LB1]GAM18017.1 hypothetical protein SAMD00019534_011920 [Acytostelium subglobosum LB1]|eukprot:XP_012758613.1 hypothetical protein SAMD00019534_011920 [Acytostelium subglobosum LB1]
MAELIGRKPLFKGDNYVDQVRRIVNILGMPCQEDIDQINNQNARDFIRKIVLENEIPKTFKEMFPYVCPLGIDLLEKMLKFNPNKRITAEQALAHPYFGMAEYVNQEPVCSKPVQMFFENWVLTKDMVLSLLKNELTFYQPREKDIPLEHPEGDMFEQLQQQQIDIVSKIDSNLRQYHLCQQWNSFLDKINKLKQQQEQLEQQQQQLDVLDNISKDLGEQLSDSCQFNHCNGITNNEEEQVENNNNVNVGVNVDASVDVNVDVNVNVNVYDYVKDHGNSRSHTNDIFNGKDNDNNNNYLSSSPSSPSAPLSPPITNTSSLSLAIQYDDNTKDTDSGSGSGKSPASSPSLITLYKMQRLQKQQQQQQQLQLQQQQQQLQPNQQNQFEKVLDDVFDLIYLLLSLIAQVIGSLLIIIMSFIMVLPPKDK